MARQNEHSFSCVLPLSWCLKNPVVSFDEGGEIMVNLVPYPQYFNRQRCVWLTLGLLLGVWLLVWLLDLELRVPPASVMLIVGAMGLCGYSLLLIHRLQQTRIQRDQALALERTVAWQTCSGLSQQDVCMNDCAARRVHTLQQEVADLKARTIFLQAQADHDELTGLFNRRSLTDHFHLAVARAKRSKMPFALLMIDLNDFKRINDDYGHEAGDMVLRITAQRLLGAVRASDTVARLGGDEFVLIIDAIASQHELHHMGQKLLAALSDPMPLNHRVVLNVSASVGLALYPENGIVMADLLHAADVAMYDCKSSRRIPL